MPTSASKSIGKWDHVTSRDVIVLGLFLQICFFPYNWVVFQIGSDKLKSLRHSNLRYS